MMLLSLLNQVLTEAFLLVSSLVPFLTWFLAPHPVLIWVAYAALSPVWNPVCLGCRLTNNHWERGCFGRYCMGDNQRRNRNRRSGFCTDNHWERDYCGRCGHCCIVDNQRRNKNKRNCCRTNNNNTSSKNMIERALTKSLVYPSPSGYIMGSHALHNVELVL